MPQTILSADGDAAVRSARNEVLRAAGFEILEAGTGADALKLAYQHQPTLILLAIELSGAGGFAVCRQLKADPRTASIPVLHISKAESHRGYLDSLESGAEGYLQEPVESPVLVGALTALIGARSVRATTGGAERDALAKDTLAALIESIPDEVWFADAQGRFALANPSALLEFKMGGPALVRVEDMARSLEVLRADGTPRPVEEAPPLRALAGETVRSQEEIVRTPVHGELRYRQVTASPVRDAAGSIVGSVSVVRDITGQKRSEQALRASEERYRTLFETMAEGFALCEIICDEAGKPRDYRHLAVNPAFARQTGRKAEEVLRGTALEAYPGTEPAWIERFGKVALTGEPARFEERFSPLGRWYEVSAFQTEPGRFGVMFADITDRKLREEQTETHRQVLETVTSKLPAGVALIRGSDLRILLANPAYQAAAPGKDMIGRTIEEVWPETQPQFRERCLQVLATGETYDALDEPFTIRRYPDRPLELTYWTWSLFRVRLPADEGWGLMSVIIETTGRRRAEDARRESEAVLRSFFDSAGMMRGIQELVDGHIVHVSCNEAVAAMLGVDRESIPGKLVTELGTPEEAERLWVGLYQNSRRTGQPFSQEYSRRGADGQERWVLATATYLGTAGNGNPRFGYTVLDLTERRRAEQALRESEAVLRAFFDSPGVMRGIVEIVDGRIFHVSSNEASAEMYGFSRESMAGKSAPEVGTSEEAERAWVGLCEQSRLTGKPVSTELARRDAAGRDRWVLATTTYIGTGPSGNPRFAYTTFDLTERKRVEEALRESEGRLVFALETTGTGAWDLDLVDHTAYRSLMHDRIFGYPSLLPRWTFEMFLEHVLPEDREEIGRKFTHAAQTRTDWNFECRIRRADGEVRWISAAGRHGRDSAGGVRRMAGVVQDITDRKLAEAALRASEERLRLTLDGTGLGTFEFRPETGESFWDAGAKAAWGLPADTEIAFPQMLEWIHPEDRSRVRAAMEAALQTGSPEQSQAEYRVIWPDGSVHWILGRSHTLFVGEGDQRRAFRMIGVHQDITARKRAEEALRESERRFSLMFGRAAFAIVLARPPEGVIVDVNEAWVKIFGYTKQEAMGKTTVELKIDLNVELRARLEAELIERGFVRDVEMVLSTKSGEERIFSANLDLLDMAGQEYILSSYQDVTERKRAEARLRDAQKLESLGLLAGGVAHDFNNLLVGVIGNASLAQDLLPPGHPAAELLDGVLKTGEQAAHLTRQMLAYSGKGKFLVEPLDLSALIPDMCGLVRPSIAKKIGLRLDLDENVPDIEADRGQIQQVFMNLVINAGEAIGSHEGLITVRTGTQDLDEPYMRLHPELAALAPGKYVCLEVRDTGSGMDEATKAKIFDPFFSTKFTGRGLGLAAVSGILRGHKSGIAVSSAPGKGSCFTVLFPAIARAPGKEPVAGRDASLQGAGTILVVDDEQFVREMVRRALERHGYTVLMADGGSAAIDVFRRHPGEIALVVLDLSMPHMNGEETLPELRKIRPEVKVVVSSGYSESDAMTLFSGQRVAGFIQKPYTSKGIAEKVKECLGQPR